MDFFLMLPTVGDYSLYNPKDAKEVKLNLDKNTISTTIKHNDDCVNDCHVCKKIVKNC